MKIGVLDRDESGLQQLITELQNSGIAAFGIPCDVTDESACATAIEKIAAEFGGIDILINNAGISQRSAFVNTEISVFRKVMAVNYFGALHCTKAALPYLLNRRGTIIVISSISGFSPLYGRSGYSASKYALHGLFESLRTELKEKGLHVMMVCPGFTNTGIEKNALDGDGSPVNHPRSTTGKVYQPEAVAEAIFKGAIRKKRLLVLSPVGKLAYVVSKFFPAFYESAMTKRLKQELER